jgi:outer membrane cobalamin receptor
MGASRGRDARAPLVILALFLSFSAFASYAGRPLSAVLDELQQRGMKLVYSSALVKPEMRVASEPHATSDRALLDEILAPHGLATKNAPDGVVLIVAARPKKEPTPVLAIPVFSLATVVVTPSDFSLLGGQPEERQFLTRKELARMPHLGDDVFRAIGRLPGAATGDVSSALQIRGGENDDVLVLVDGLEVFEPFHIKDFNVFSIVDTEAIGGIDYVSGGMPSEYGNRMGAVVDMSIASPSKRRTYLGVSFTHARFLSEGTFGQDDRGEWLVSARRGYLDLVLNLTHQTNHDVSPRYYDVLGKVQYRLGEKNVLSADVLAAFDHLRYATIEERSDGSYGNTYAWLNLRTSWTPRLFSQSVASAGRVTRNRKGGFDQFDQTATVGDQRSLNVQGLKQDWTFDLSDRRHYVKWGYDARRFSASYDYSSRSVLRASPLQVVTVPIESARDESLRPHGTSLALYAADRMRLAQNLTVEAGARFEYESWAGEGGAVVPRLNVAWSPSPATTVRAAWGRYRQAQAMNELRVEDGDSTFHPAQRSTQSVIGVQQRVAGGVELRVDVYQKEISHVRPHFENMFDSLEFFPEVKFDRIRIAPQSSRAHGVEIVAKKDDGAAPLSWFLSIARAKVTDRIDGRDVPRSWDQPNALSFSANYRKSQVWSFNVSGLYHSGWPTTPLSARYVPLPGGFLVEPDLGARNTGRLPGFARLDTRISRSVSLSHGTFSAWLEVTNLLNHRNVCCVQGFTFYVDQGQRVVDVRGNNTGVGRLPSFGVAWEF